jgi:hypothetical protein
LLFEEYIDRFLKGYEMKKSYSDTKKYAEEEGYNAFSNMSFELVLGNIVNKISTTKNKTHYRYYLIKESSNNK